MPNQLKLEFVLWTRHAVQSLIEAEYGVLLPTRTVGLYLQRWGYTPQRPAKPAYEQCSGPRRGVYLRIMQAAEGVKIG